MQKDNKNANDMQQRRRAKRHEKEREGGGREITYTSTDHHDTRNTRREWGGRTTETKYDMLDIFINKLRLCKAVTDGFQGGGEATKTEQ